MYPVPSAVREPICCECQARFGGCLPMPRVKAALPYWVPLSLRPRKQVGDLSQASSSESRVNLRGPVTSQHHRYYMSDVLQFLGDSWCFSLNRDFYFKPDLWS